MRGAPQVGFSATTRKIRSRTSWGIRLRPVTWRTLEMARQYIAKPARCRRTASGLTTMSTSFHPAQNRLARTQNILSNGPICGRG